jgi:hypothetical protein
MPLDEGFSVMGLQEVVSQGKVVSQRRLVLPHYLDFAFHNTSYHVCQVNPMSLFRQSGNRHIISVDHPTQFGQSDLLGAF